MKMQFYSLSTLVLLLCTVFVIVRPHNPRVSGIPAELMTEHKLNFYHEADFVFFGDSRTETNISPEDIARAFPKGTVILNCGFSAQSLSKEYFDYAIDVLKPASDGRKRYIVIGISDSNLGIESLNSPYHIDFADRPRTMWTKRVEYAFAACNVDEIKVLLGKKLRLSKQTHMHENGWNEIIVEKGFFQQKADGSTTGIRSSKSYETGLEFLQEMIQYATQKNVTVIVWTPPKGISPTGVESKDQPTYNQQKLIDTVRAAGGIFIDLPKVAYTTYDGSHLESESAKRLSRILGQKLAVVILR